MRWSSSFGERGTGECALKFFTFVQTRVIVSPVMFHYMFDANFWGMIGFVVGTLICFGPILFVWMTGKH